MEEACDVVAEYASVIVSGSGVMLPTTTWGADMLPSPKSQFAYR